LIDCLLSDKLLCWLGLQPRTNSQKNSKGVFFYQYHRLTQRNLERSLRDLIKGDAFNKLLLCCVGCKQIEKLKQSKTNRTSSTLKEEWLVV